MMLDHVNMFVLDLTPMSNYFAQWNSLQTLTISILQLLYLMGTSIVMERPHCIKSPGWVTNCMGILGNP